MSPYNGGDQLTKSQPASQTDRQDRQTEGAKAACIVSDPYNGSDQLRPVVTHKADGVEDVHLPVDLQLVPADVH